MAQRRRFGVRRLCLQSDIGVLDDVQPFGIGRHQPVLDAVMHHLREMSGAVLPAVQVALLGGARIARRTRRARRRVDPGSQRFEDRVEPLHHVRLAADHVAIAALQPPHAATDADIDA